MRAKRPFGLLSLIVVSLLAGCPSGTPSDPNSGTNANDNAGVSNGEDGVNDATGILVAAPDGSEAISVDLYVAGTDQAVKTAQSAGQVIDVAAGTYRLHEYAHGDFVFAPSVTVTAGAVTHVTLGAIRVTTVAGSATATYDLYDASGDTLLDQVNDTDEIRAVPAGTYLLKEYFHDQFVFAQDVVVTEGAVTTVALGAINLHSVDGAETAIYDILAEDGQTLLDQVNDTNTIRPVPAGTYVLKEYFNDALVYAADVVVQAGALTERSLGAVRYNGGEAIYDIYDESGEGLLDRVNDRGVIRSLPPGTYVLKPYFEDTVLAEDVAVVAGSITDVP